MINFGRFARPFKPRKAPKLVPKFGVLTQGSFGTPVGGWKSPVCQNEVKITFFFKLIRSQT